MFTKVMSVLAVVAATTAQHGYQHSPSPVYQPQAYNAPAYQAPAYHAPAYHVPAKSYHEEAYPDAHPQYNFKYAVEDVHTGDVHSQQEERDGDVVHGEYSLVQPDGITRIVHYTADKNGFNAQVAYNGHAAHPQGAQAKIAAPTPVYNHYH